MHRSIVCFALAASAALACSEAVDHPLLAGSGGAGTDASTGGGASSSGGGGGGASSSGGGGGGASSSGGGGSDGGGSSPDAAAAGSIAINEISGKGEEWVELFNTGGQAVDVSDWAVTDRNKDGGGPDIGHIVKFPQGTTLSPNTYLLVAGAPKDAGPGVDAAACPAGGQAYCFVGQFGISNKSGETIYVIGTSNTVSAQADYPANTVGTGQTWGRMPNGTGSFAINAATPGASNKTP